MATNYIQAGDTVTVAAPSGGTTSGLAYLIGGIFGVATTTQLVSVNVELVTEGVWNLVKVGSQAWSVGDRIYWDDANVRCTSTPSAGIYIGVCTVAVASGAGDITGKVRLNGITPQISSGIVDAAAATLTVTAAKHSGKIITLNLAAGIAVTLPAATGSGDRYRFIIKTTFTGAATIKVVTDDVMQGYALLAQDGGATSVMFETAVDSDTISFDGSTTGGLVGTEVELIDYSADRWFAKVVGAATGTEATPFSATVS